MIAFGNLAKAHVAAYRTLHKIRRDIMVGFAHSAPLVVPCNPKRKRDLVAAAVRDIILNRAFFYLLGARAGKRRDTSRRLDFIGINYYTRMIVRGVGLGVGALFGRVCRLAHHHDRGPISDMGWEVYPRGLRLILAKFSKFGVPLLVTENGIATNDESLRSDFIIEHLESLAEASASDANVIGYLYWSLMDNYEWARGMEPHFGLAAVDSITQERRPRPCVENFARICRENHLGDRDKITTIMTQANNR
jgi:beta-glucosidase